jgi:hypothetical protein
MEMHKHRIALYLALIITMAGCKREAVVTRPTIDIYGMRRASEQVEANIAAHIQPDRRHTLVPVLDVLADSNFPSPLAFVPFADAQDLILENNLGKLLVLHEWSTDKPHLLSGSLALDLKHPISMRVNRDEVMIGDGDTYKTLDLATGKTTANAVFLPLQSFISLPKQRILISPSVLYRDDLDLPLLLAIDRVGKRVGTVGARLDSPPTGTELSATNLARCGERVFALPIASTSLLEVNAETLQVRPIPLKIPGAAGIQRLNLDPSLTRPKGDTYTVARISAGIACGSDRVYVLADLPRLTIYSFDFKGELRDTYASAEQSAHRHFTGLELRTVGKTMNLYTISINSVTGDRHLLVFGIPVSVD